MPELPEVETIVRALREAVPGRTIRAIGKIHPRPSRYSSPALLIRYMANTTITHLDRRGKYILFDLKDRPVPVVFHMGMSGQLLLGQETSASPHVKAEITFTDGGYLHFIDPRMFGLIFIGNESSPPGYRKLGPDPLSSTFTARKLETILAGRSMIIKTLLLQQHLIAGIGNIYASETLFRAGIHPETPGCELGKEQITRLHRTLRKVLREAIDQMGTTLSDFRRPDGTQGEYGNKLLVYDRHGEPCPQCGTTIQRVIHHARSTFFCPRCQSI